MKVFTETPSAAALSSSRDLRPSPSRSEMRADSSSPSPTGVGRPGVVFDVGHIDVVARDPDVHAPVRERGRQLGGGSGQEIEDAPGHRPAEEVGNPLGHLRHDLVPEFADRDHVGTQPVDHQ